MKNTYRFLIYYAYEYKLLERYLQDMANKGYRLISLQGAIRYMLTFERCEPQDLYYYVDFHSNYSVIDPRIPTPSQVEYRELIEEYGYEYVDSLGALQVFVSKEPINIPIREENEETKAEMKRIVYKELITKLLCTVLYFVMVLLQLRSLAYDYYAHSALIFSTWLVMALFWMTQEVSYLYWLIRQKSPKSLRYLRIRSAITIILLLSISSAMLCAIHPLIGRGFAAILLILAGKSCLRDWLYIRMRKQDRRFSHLLPLVAILIALVVVVFPYGGDTPHHAKDLSVHGYHYEETFYEESLLSSHTMYVKESLNEESLYDFDVVELKNTFLNHLLKGSILRVHKFQETGSYRNMTIYRSDYQTCFQMGERFIIVDSDDIGESFTEEAYTFIQTYKP